MEEREELKRMLQVMVRGEVERLLGILRSLLEEERGHEAEELIRRFHPIAALYLKAFLEQGEER